MSAGTQLQSANYRSAFASFAETATGRNLSWLQELREGAFARFCEAGFPTTRVEDWRFTNVSPIAQAGFQLARNGSSLVSKQQIEPYRIEGSACLLVFVNGHFAPELSALPKLPAGVRVGSLARQIAESPRDIEAHLGRYLNTHRDPFCALNTAFLEDGAYVSIRRGTVMEAPIHLLFVSAGQSIPLMNHPRNLVVAEDGSQIAVVEEYVSLDNTVGFCNSATELVAGDDAIVSHTMIERENTEAFNTSTLRIQQGRNANVASHSVLIGGALVRNNVHPVLAGEGGECLINGLFIGSGRQHLDNYMLVEHAGPHTGSRQFYNGILDQHAHGVFHGRIVVHKDAQKTDAKQTNRNLLLSNDAQIDTKPQLEIFADDVKCTHGATIGQIEEDALFYLRSRGIGEVSARQLLLLAFASECLERMKDWSTRAHIEALIHGCIFQLAGTTADLGDGPRETVVQRTGEAIQ